MQLLCEFIVNVRYNTSLESNSLKSIIDMSGVNVAKEKNDNEKKTEDWFR